MSCGQYAYTVDLSIPGQGLKHPPMYYIWDALKGRFSFIANLIYRLDNSELSAGVKLSY